VSLHNSLRQLCLSAVAIEDLVALHCSASSTCSPVKQRGTILQPLRKLYSPRVCRFLLRRLHGIDGPRGPIPSSLHIALSTCSSLSMERSHSLFGRLTCLVLVGSSLDGCTVSKVLADRFRYLYNSLFIAAHLVRAGRYSGTERNGRF
jgi:hypothetical protein